MEGCWTNSPPPPPSRRGRGEEGHWKERVKTKNCIFMSHFLTLSNNSVQRKLEGLNFFDTILEKLGICIKGVKKLWLIIGLNMKNNYRVVAWTCVQLVNVIVLHMVILICIYWIEDRKLINVFFIKRRILLQISSYLWKNVFLIS